MKQSVRAHIILCLREFLIRIFGFHYPTELILLIVTASYTKIKIKISSGWDHTSVMMNNKVYCWGYNKDGRLGLGHTNNEHSPQKLNFKNIKSIKCGSNNTIMLTNNSDIYICGHVRPCNDLGIVNNIILSSFYMLHARPIGDITKIKIGNTIPCNNLMLITHDKLYVTSHNTLKTLVISDMRQIKYGGSSYIMVVKKIGTLYGWGNNHFGQLGLGHNNNSDSFQQIPLSNVITIDCGYSHTIVATLDDKIYVWGRNYLGNLGLGDQHDKNSPHELVLPVGCDRPATGLHRPTTLRIGSICCGAEHTLVLLQNDIIYVWGYNKYGQLGLGHNDHAYTPQKLCLSHIVKIYSSGDSTFGVTKDDEIYAWGSNNYGQLGLGDETHRSSPTKLEFKF